MVFQTPALRKFSSNIHIQYSTHFINNHIYSKAFKHKNLGFLKPKLTPKPLRWLRRSGCHIRTPLCHDVFSLTWVCRVARFSICRWAYLIRSPLELFQHIQILTIISNISQQITHLTLSKDIVFPSKNKEEISRFTKVKNYIKVHMILLSSPLVMPS